MHQTLTFPFVLRLQNKVKLKDIMAPAIHGSHRNMFPHTMAEDPAAAPASSAACIPPKRSTQLTIKKQHQLLLTGPPARLLLEAPRGAARADAVTTAIVVFAAKDFTMRTARASAPPGTLLLTGPAPLLLLTGPPPVLLLEAAPRLLLLPAPPIASPPAFVTTAVAVFIAKDSNTRRQTTNAAHSGPLLLTGPALQLLLAGPPTLLMLEAPPARLLMLAPPVAPPPANATIAAMVVMAKGTIKLTHSARATAHLPLLTGPAPVLLLTWPPRRLLMQALSTAAPPTAAPPTGNMTSMAVSACVRKDLTPWAARVMTRPQLPAGPLIRPLEPHPRLLLQKLPAASLPPMMKTKFVVRSSLREDGTKQPASMTARPLLLTWPAPVQPVTAPAPALLEVRGLIPEDLAQGLSSFLDSMSQVLMQDCILLIANTMGSDETQYRLVDGLRNSGCSCAFRQS